VETEYILQLFCLSLYPGLVEFALRFQQVEFCGCLLLDGMDVTFLVKREDVKIINETLSLILRWQFYCLGPRDSTSGQ
jgi:hypothetical protein